MRFLLVSVVVVTLFSPRLVEADERTANSSDVPISRKDVLAMRSVPDGNYLVNLQLAGQERLLNIKVSANVGVCVKSDNARFTGLRGEFQLIGNGVFVVYFEGAGHRASQYWLFRGDGTAVVREVPDRGEKQTAVPVPDDSLEVRKTAD